MPSIFHTNTSALITPARFPVGSLVVDARYRTQLPPWSPTAVQALFAPGGYVHVPSLGSMECSARDFAAVCQVIDYSSGLTEVSSKMTGQDVVVLCDCAEQSGRCHRRLVAHELAHALGLTEAGPLP